MTEDVREETKMALIFALDTGGDIAGTTPQKHMQERWEYYIEDQVELVMWEEDRLPENPDEFIEEMKEVAPEVADELGYKIVKYDTDEQHNMSKAGLYLGKFAPLHKGHQYCIETAMEEVDDLVLLIYDEPDVTDIPLVTRSQWLRDLYGDSEGVTVLEAWTAPTELGYDNHTKAKHEKYVINKLDSRGINNVDVYFSSEPYGEHMSNALGAVDYRVDEERNEYPVSATMLRKAMNVDYYEYVKEWVDERVHRDLVTNVALLGGPSTGKTTLAKALARAYGTKWMPEFGREYWEENADADGMLTVEQLNELAELHIEEENEMLSKANKYLFTDTNAITTGLFSKWYHNEIYENLEYLMAENAQRYDVLILCDDDIPFEEEEGRGGPEGRKRLQRMHESWLDAKGIPYHRVSGSVEERVKQVSEIIEGFNKWDHEQ